MEIRALHNRALLDALEVIPAVDAEWGEATGREWGGLTWEHLLDDAEVVLVAAGSLATQPTVAAEELRAAGVKAGVLGIRAYRPFPVEALAEKLAGKRLALVFDKAMSYGYEGPICSDLRGALLGVEARAHGVGRGVRARRARRDRRPTCGRRRTRGRRPRRRRLRSARPTGSTSTWKARGPAMTKIIDLPDTHYVLPGNRACAGCAIGIGLRSITAALEGQMVMTVPASCLTVLRRHVPDQFRRRPVGQRRLPLDRRRGRRARRRPARRGQGRPDDGARHGRRRRHRRHRHPGALGCRRAQRRLHLPVLRQRGVHEHRHAALRPHAERRAHDDHRHGQAREPEGPAAHHGGARHPLRRVHLGGLPRRRLRQGRQGPRRSTACATST